MVKAQSRGGELFLVRTGGGFVYPSVPDFIKLAWETSVEVKNFFIWESIVHYPFPLLDSGGGGSEPQLGYLHSSCEKGFL